MTKALMTKSSSKKSFEETSKFLGKPHIRFRQVNTSAKQNRKTIFLGSSELCHLWRTSTFTPNSCVDFDCLVGGTVSEVHKMFLNGYRNNHSPLNVIVSCGLNNIPRYSFYSLDLSSFGLKDSLHNNADLIYKLEDWKEVETLKKLYISDTVKRKVSVSFTKLCNDFDWYAVVYSPSQSQVESAC